MLTPGVILTKKCFSDLVMLLLEGFKDVLDYWDDCHAVLTAMTTRLNDMNESLPLKNTLDTTIHY